MIRLYADQEFLVGAKISLSKEEFRYFQTVRRAQGPVVLFNRRGQTAYGELEKGIFSIDRVETNFSPLWPIVVYQALPENSSIPSIVRAVSELGVRDLRFFEGRRSQNFKKRVSLERWEKIALEAARQCERSQPLRIEIADFQSLCEFPAQTVVFLDEAKSDKKNPLSVPESKDALALVVGPEGGWTEEERDVARQNRWHFLHFPTPILRVETAVTCACLFGVLQLFHSVDPLDSSP